MGREPREEIMTDAAAQTVIDMLETGLDWARWGASEMQRAQRCSGHGYVSPLDETVFLVRHVLGLPQDSTLDWLRGRLLHDERTAIYEALHERIVDARPVAYITGEAWFAGMPFLVDERVLVPRSPLAELVHQRFSPWLSHPPTRILDLCCGSGCIGLAAAMAFPEATLVLADLSPDALAVAAMNVEFHGLEERATLVESDLFDALADETFDLILTNPPYVPSLEVDALPEEFAHEPRMGLESGEDGMEHPRRIVSEARRHLRAGGSLIGEVGAWRPELEAAFPAVPFTWVELEQGGEGIFVVGEDDLPR